MLGLLFLAAVVSPAPAVVSPAPAVTPGEAYRIYAAAMRNLATLDQPAFVDLTEKRVTTTTAAISGDVLATDVRTLRGLFDSTTRRECIFAEPRDREVVIGPSFFAPDTWLIKRGRPAAPAPSTPNMAPDLSDLKIIANVVAVESPSYAIRLAGTATAGNGDTVDHLVLTPRSDPEKHNLRELWIDEKTNRIVRAIVQGTYRPFPRDPIEKTFALENFGQVGPYWLVIHHLWTYAPPSSGLLLKLESTVETMRFPATLPDWLFDERAFREHTSELDSVLATPSP